MPLSGGGFGSPATVRRADAAGLGLGASEHALLGAVVELPASGGVVLTGRLVAGVAGVAGRSRCVGVVVFPGAGFVELAIRAGDEVGCSVVDELTLQAPLMLPASGSVAVQVVVGAGSKNPAGAVCRYSPGPMPDSGVGLPRRRGVELRVG